MQVTALENSCDNVTFITGAFIHVTTSCLSPCLAALRRAFTLLVLAASWLVVPGALAQTVSSAATLCSSITQEATATNLVTNSDFSDTATSSIGAGGGVGTATLNTEPGANRVAYQTGTRVITASNPDLNQRAFPGDTARNVAAATNWLLANGNSLAAGAGIWWSQTVSGLTVGRTYTFIVYASSPTDGAQGGTLPSLRLRVSQAATTTSTLGSITTDTAAADVWYIMQALFVATQSTADLAILNMATTNNTERRGQFAIARPVVRLCAPLINLSVTKTNSASTVTAGGTASYDIIVTNSGLAAADDSILTDDPGTGLSCSSVSCSTSGGAAACPAVGTNPGELSIANLVSPGTGVTIATLPAGSSLTFSLSCAVTASGS